MDYKSGQQLLQNGAAFRDYKSGQVQRLQNRAKGLQIGAWITKPGKKITNRGRDYKFGKNLTDLWLQV